MEIYNKLVRDKIDEIINNNGKNEKAFTKILNNEEYQKELIKKLDEDYGEEYKELIIAINSGIKEDIIEESADLIEVIRAINDDNLDLVINKLEDKRNKKGGFSKRKYLEYVKKN